MYQFLGHRRDVVASMGRIYLLSKYIYKLDVIGGRVSNIRQSTYGKANMEERCNLRIESLLIEALRG